MWSAALHLFIEIINKEWFAAAPQQEQDYCRDESPNTQVQNCEVETLLQTPYIPVYATYCFANLRSVCLKVYLMMRTETSAAIVRSVCLRPQRLS